MLAETQSNTSSRSEPRYYTWVDAQGVMHNTLIESESPAEKIPQQAPQENPHESEVVNPEFNTDNFPSEEQHEKNLEKRKADQKPFFTWTDAQGIIRSELKPEVVADFVAEEVVYDAVFAPPFRLPSYVTEGQCCESYEQAFTAITKFNGSASYQVDDTLFLFKTQNGDVAAGYFSVPNLADHEIILLKGYKLPVGSQFEVIALNADFKPIYLGSKLEGIVVEQTWKDLAYQKVLLEISDPEIKYFVIFARSENTAAAKSLSNYRISLLREPLGD